MHVISDSGIHPDPDTASRIPEWPTPKTGQQVRGFLGHMSFYRKFVRRFAGIAASLHRLTEKSKPLSWAKEYEQVFAQLKQVFVSPPILNLPNVSPSSCEFGLDIDASKTAIGAVFFQMTADGDH
ncbi:hypothetical protein AAHC03_021068 [Spirometra sp. Aus1]